MDNLLNTPLTRVAACVLALTLATQTIAEEMLVIDPVSGEATFFTDPTPAVPADIVDVNVVHPTTGETISLADIDVATLTEGDRRFIGDQLYFQGMQLDQAERANLTFN